MRILGERRVYQCQPRLRPVNKEAPPVKSQPVLRGRSVPESTIPPSLHKDIAGKISRHLAQQEGGPSSVNALNDSLRFLAKWRSALLQETWLQREGNRVKFGPFAGMQLGPRSGEGCHLAKLMGVYEQPLWTVIMAAISRQYSSIINVGAAEGYYAIGMALQMPEGRILAYEGNPVARAVLEELVTLNEVGHRVDCRGMFRTEDLAACDGQPVLVICDIEGGEFDLFSELSIKFLRNADLIIETHDVGGRGLTAELARRFSETHDATLVSDNGMRTFEAPAWFQQLSHLDQLLATWEWRSSPTPWLVLKPKA